MSDGFKKILLVEDDQFLVDIYHKKFKEASFEVKVVHDGEEALLTLENDDFDLVLLDIVLPRIDGWEVLRRIKNNNAKKHIPVLILSSLGQKSEIEKGLGLGADDYLIKAHFTPSEVVEKIEAILGAKRG